MASKTDYHIASQNPLTLTLKKDWKYRDECQYLENITNQSQHIEELSVKGKWGSRVGCSLVAEMGLKLNLK